MRTHYPRTPHLPWSPGASTDDVRVADLSGFAGREVVVTEKLDGENTTLYPDGLHARSLDSAHHPSRAWVKALHGRIAHHIPAGWRVCGENVFARHSIAYDDLSSWFYLFSVWAADRCLGWDDTVRFSRRLGVPVPPVLWRGVFDERAVRGLRLDLARQEGYVVRTVAGFDRSDFGGRVAKWVRRDHVVTDTHWMLAPVVPNGRGPAAVFWDVRSGAAPDRAALATALGEPPSIEDIGDDVAARLDLLGRSGEARLAGVLAATLRSEPRPALLGRLAPTLGLPLARRVGDLVGLHPLLYRPFPDEDRLAGLRRLAVAADLGVLHAVAGAAARTAQAKQQLEWSTLYADDGGLLAEAPLSPLRTGLQAAGGNDRCWAEARAAFADGRIRTVEEATALTWRWREGDYPRLIVLVGPSGSGKSHFASTLTGVDEIVSMDDAREARGSRSNQRDNAAVLRESLDRLERALTGRRTVVWDATSLVRPQRSLVDKVAHRQNAWTTHAVLVAGEAEAARRNAARAHPVPADVLAAQFLRFAPPYPGEAHRTWYVGLDGAVADTAGAIDSEDP
jgi:predicted kinase